MDAQQRPTARILSEQIHVSLRLLPVSLAGQIIGALGIAARFWPLVNHIMLIGWLVALTITIWLWARLRRRFLADTQREAHIREWLKQWMLQSVATGIVWGFAGVAFLITQDTMDIVVLVSVMVAVVFASWPAYSCWIPSLFAVMLLSLGPLTLGLTSALEIGRTALTVIVIVLICFVLYSGRRLSEVVVMAVTRDAQNERLVARLKSEKSRAESERRAVAAASERRAKFFAGANHDLRQPLQAMGIYLQILQMQSTPESKDVIAQLGATAQNISTLVEQLLEVSRIETGHLDVKMENVNVTELFNELAAEFAPVAATKGFFFLTRPLPLTVFTDPLFVKRILTNLITNAIRYSQKPGSKIVLAARRLRNGRITIGVYDQGPGIASEERHRIFDAFYRGEASKTAETGYGLGLYLGFSHPEFDQSIFFEPFVSANTYWIDYERSNRYENVHFETEKTHHSLAKIGVTGGYRNHCNDPWSIYGQLAWVHRFAGSTELKGFEENTHEVFKTDDLQESYGYLKVSGHWQASDHWQLSANAVGFISEVVKPKYELGLSAAYRF